MNDKIKKPVHRVLGNSSNIENISNSKGLDSPVPLPDRSALPKEEQKKFVSPLGHMKSVSSLSKQANLKVKLSIIYEKVPPLPADKIPDCDSCSAACCRVFIVELSKEEYESGNFGEYAIKITADATKQFRSKLGMAYAALVPQLSYRDGADRYLLEGVPGEPCPFLEGNKCGIYDIRPYTCRAYTCVGDSRITNEMKEGKK